LRPGTNPANRVGFLQDAEVIH